MAYSIRARHNMTKQLSAQLNFLETTVESKRKELLKCEAYKSLPGYAAMKRAINQNVRATEKQLVLLRKRILRRQELGQIDPIL